MGLRHNFYVYEHWRPDTGLPFYVGKGIRGRASSLRRRSVRHRHVLETLRQSALKVEVRKIFTYLDEKTAFTLEQAQIAYWRLHNVDLVNLTDGGDGISGYKFTAAQNENKKAALRRPETRARISQRSKENHADPEIKARHRAAVTAGLAKPEVRATLSILAKSWYSKPGSKAKHRAACIAATTPEITIKRTATNRARMATQEGREAMRVRTTLLNNRPETREKISIKTKEALASPEVKARISASSKAAWVRRKAASAAVNLEATTCIR